MCAGDSHTAVLTQHGHVYCWGYYRDNSGPLLGNVIFIFFIDFCGAVCYMRTAFLILSDDFNQNRFELMFYSFVPYDFV